MEETSLDAAPCSLKTKGGDASDKRKSCLIVIRDETLYLRIEILRQLNGLNICSNKLEGLIETLSLVRITIKRYKHLLKQTRRVD